MVGIACCFWRATLVALLVGILPSLVYSGFLPQTRAELKSAVDACSFDACQDDNDPVHHPSALRNRVPILKALVEILGTRLNSKTKKLSALEIASGTGCHVEYFAKAMPSVLFQPSEYVPASIVDDASVGRIGSRGKFSVLDALNLVASRFENVLKAVAIDVSRPLESWPVSVQKKFELIYVSNLIHISPWKCSVGFLNAAGRLVADDGFVLLYGPFKKDNRFTSSSNENFDKALRARNAEWGYRDIGALQQEAEKTGLALHDVREMPVLGLGLNFLLTFVKGKGK